MEGFSLLSHKASSIAINNRLTGSQFRLWHYLMMVDPFADQTSEGERIYHDIPSPDQIGLAIGVQARTVENDMARLEELGLYAKRITAWQGYNLSAEEARNATAAMKQAEAAAAPFPVEHPKCPEPRQDNGLYTDLDHTYLSEGDPAATMPTSKTDPLLGIGTQSAISLQRQRAQASITPNYQFSGPWETKEQFQSFQKQLYEYAKQEGKPSPSEWVFKIIDGITKGIDSPLWHDFKAGRRLGSADGIPIYRVKRGPNGINPDFASYVCQWMISFRKSDVPISEAIAYIIKREPGGYLESEWSVLLAKAQEWYESLVTSNTPTEGETLANELAIVLNSPQTALVEDRFEKVNGKYKWETQPGEPVPALLDWYSQQIKLSKRTELSGKPAMVIAREDFRDRFLAASIYEEWRKYAAQLIGNHDMQIASMATQTTNKELSSGKTEASSATVDVTPNPISMKQALVPDDPEERIKFLQEFYDISGVHKVIVRGWLKDNIDKWYLEIVNHKIQEIPF